MATAKKKKPSKKAPTSAVEPMIHTEATATLLAFASPPAADPEPIARGCVETGLITIGITGPFQPEFPIDFGGINRDSCRDFGDAINLCVGSQGFHAPALSGPFVILHDRGIVMTFENLVRAVAKMMRPK